MARVRMHKATNCSLGVLIQNVVAQMKPNRPLFLQSKQVLALQDQKVFNKMLIST